VAGENYIMTTFVICTVLKMYSGEQIKEEQMGRSYGTNERDKQRNTKL
jgi:hypothetical protein